MVHLFHRLYGVDDPAHGLKLSVRYIMLTQMTVTQCGSIDRATDLRFTGSSPGLTCMVALGKLLVNACVPLSLFGADYRSL